MASSAELRDQLGMQRWTDSQLLRLLASKVFEVSPILEGVSAQDAFVIGAETLLRTEIRVDGMDEEFPEDPLTGAMVAEARARIAHKFGPVGVENLG